jgi:hypothetical protein
LDSRIPVGLILAALLAFFTRRAQQTGEALNRSSILYRSEYPRLFVTMIAMRWIGVVALVFMSAAIAMGWRPENPN